MSLSDDQLIKRAREVQVHAYAPYSQFKVGAALLTAEGQVFTGCNVENSTFGATICAERTAVFTAVCHGVRHFSKIVIVTDNKEPAWPCGICRSVLYEFAPDLEVVAVGSSGKVERMHLSQLYPKGFRFSMKNE